MDRIINNWYLFQDAVETARVSWLQEFIINRGVYVSDSAADARAMLPHAIWHTRTARGLSSNSLPVNAGRAMTELTAQVAQEDDPDFLYKDWFFGTPEIVAEKIYRGPVRWRHLLELYLQPGPDPAREDHALYGAVCHEGHAALPRL